MSWLSRKLGKKSVCETVSTIEALVSKFVSEGFLFYMAFDPEGPRHHTKKASTYREFERQKKMVSCIKAKSQILLIRRELRQGGHTIDDDKRKAMYARLHALEKEAKTGEKANLDCELHPQVIESVRRSLEQLELSHPGRIFVVEGRFQADSYIQHLLTTSQVDLAIGNDADFSFIAGRHCLQVSDFHVKVSKKKGIEIDDISIATGFSETIQFSHSHLGSSNVSLKKQNIHC
jgi:DNA integrity scanning protein DisA with diadenylate cyclase activity